MLAYYPPLTTQLAGPSHAKVFTSLGMPTCTEMPARSQKDRNRPQQTVRP